jgi:hypothetical protein
MKYTRLGKTVDMSDTMAVVELELEALDLKEFALDYIDTYQNDEIAQMVREGILTIEEVEAGLRRKHA